MYNIFVQTLYSYLRYTDWLLDVLFLLFTVILSNIIITSSKTKKKITDKSTYKNLC